MKLTTDEIEEVGREIRALVLNSKKQYTIIRVPLSWIRPRVPTILDGIPTITPREPEIICKGVWWEDRDGRREMRWEIECTPVISIHDSTKTMGG